MAQQKLHVKMKKSIDNTVVVIKVARYNRIHKGNSNTRSSTNNLTNYNS